MLLPKRRAGNPIPRIFALAAALQLAALAGCSTKNSPTGTGDASGLRLGVFASDRGQAAGQYDIYVWDYDALQFRSTSSKLRSTAAERHPSISSDGRFVAFQVDRGTGNGDDIEMYDRLHDNFVDLAGLNTTDAESEPVFTGDGLKLCFVQGRSVRRIRMYDGQTRKLVPLPGLDTTGVTYSDYSPAPDRDGTLIAFASDRSGNPDMYLYHRTRKVLLDGPKLRQALRSGGDDLDPSFGASGRFLAFSSDRTGAQGLHDIFLLEFVYSSTVQDTVLRDVSAANSPSDERHPAVSENGAILVFQSDRPGGQGKWDVWNFDRNTSQVGQYPGYDSPGDDIEPSIKWPY